MSGRLADTLRYGRWAAFGALGPILLVLSTRTSASLFLGGAPTSFAAVAVLLLAPVAVFVLRVTTKPVRLVEAVATTTAVAGGITALLLLVAPGALGLGAAAAMRALALFLLAAAACLASAILLETRRLVRRR